jgi:hypothetical protein
MSCSTNKWDVGSLAVASPASNVVPKQVEDMLKRSQQSAWENPI